MTHLPRVLSALSRLLSYPDEQVMPVAELLYVVLQDELPDAAHEAAQFGRFLEQHDINEVQEVFTRTFDVNPTCALEVGWHLFGEEYARGMFLVRMREELRKYGLPESAELPDHISHVLALIAAMPEDEAERFVRACVQPAVQRMQQALAKSESPYRHVTSCLASLIEGCWGSAAGDGHPQGFGSLASGVDPLNAFPVNGLECTSRCGNHCDGAADIEFVPLETSSSALSQHVPTPRPNLERKP